MTEPLAMLPNAAAVTYVPDGDPCPKFGHEGKPTRLFHIAGAGWCSQCENCVKDFYAWRAANRELKPLPGDLAPLVPSKPSNYELGIG